MSPVSCACAALLPHPGQVSKKRSAPLKSVSRLPPLFSERTALTHVRQRGTPSHRAKAFAPQSEQKLKRSSVLCFLTKHSHQFSGCLSGFRAADFLVVHRYERYDFGSSARQEGFVGAEEVI